MPEKGWIDDEATFEELEIPTELEMNCADELMARTDDGLEYVEELDPDAGWIKALAAGEYRHPAPSSVPSEPSEDDRPVSMPCMPDQARLACFAELMGWTREGGLDEAGYLKAVVQNKPGMAAVIKDLAGIKAAEGVNA